MGILEDLLGAGERKRDYSDFVNRYEHGHASEGYSDKEVMQRYNDVAHEVPKEDYAQAAQEALARLSPQERAEFVKMLQERAQARGQQLPRQIEPSPKDLGDVLTDLHQTPGRLRDILGGGPSAGAGGAGAPGAGGSGDPGILASPLARAALAGIAAMVVKRVMKGSAA